MVPDTEIIMTFFVETEIGMKKNIKLRLKLNNNVATCVYYYTP